MAKYMPIKMQDILSENMPDKMQGRMPKYKCQRGCQRSCKDLCQKESTSVFTIQIKSLGLCNKPTWSLDQLGPCTSSRKSRKELVLKVNQCWPPLVSQKKLGADHPTTINFTRSRGILPIPIPIRHHHPPLVKPSDTVVFAFSDHMLCWNHALQSSSPPLGVPTHQCRPMHSDWDHGDIDFYGLWIIHIYIWLYMIIYDYIWLYMIIYDYIWLYMIIYDYIWLYIIYSMHYIYIMYTVWIFKTRKNGSVASILQLKQAGSYPMTV